MKRSHDENDEESDPNSTDTDTETSCVESRRRFYKTIRIPVSDVSEWDKADAELFNIFYHENYLPNPEDVLSKIGNISELTEDQRYYMNRVKSALKFNAIFDCKEHGRITRDSDCFYKDYLQPVFLKILRNINREENTNNIQTIILNTTADNAVGNFITKLDQLMKNIYNQPEKTICDSQYTELCRTFANMCHLDAMPGDTDPTRWGNLSGIKVVVSKPDLRLYKKGKDMISYGIPETVVSVVQVKKERKKDEVHSEQRSIRRRNSSSSSEPERHRMRRSSSSNSRSSSVIPIEMDLGSNVIGQHAGELLLDRRRFAFKQNIAESNNWTMPGMIVNETKVYFTLLEISAEHSGKIRQAKNRTELIANLNDKEDRATLYYSKPLDILLEKERNILIENFIRLNNI